MLAKKESSLSSFPCSFTEPSSQICSNIIRCCWWSSHLAVSAPHLAVSAPYKWLFMHRANRPLGASLVAQMVKNLPIMLKAWVWSLGREDPLQKRMATHSSILAWRIPWTEEPGGLQSMGLQRVGQDRVTKNRPLTKNFYFSWFLISIPEHICAGMSAQKIFQSWARSGVRVLSGEWPIFNRYLSTHFLVGL